MEKKENILPAKSMGYLIICGAVIVILILVGVLPLYRYNTSVKRQVEKLQYALEEQKGLGPVYQALTQAQAKNISGALPDPPKQALAFDQADSFQDCLSEIGLSDDIAITVRHTDTACHLAREGVGIAVVDGFVISSGLTQGLAIRPLEGSPPVTAFAHHRDGAPLDRSARILLSHLAGDAP